MVTSQIDRICSNMACECSKNVLFDSMRIDFIKSPRSVVVPQVQFIKNGFDKANVFVTASKIA